MVKANESVVNYNFSGAIRTVMYAIVFSCLQ
jgi:hypothetical protein